MNCIELTTYSVIASKNPDLKSFFQTMKNQWNAAYSQKFIDSKVMATWDINDPVDYFQEGELLTLIQSINIQN